MKKISLAYFGTPEFSARFLEKLLTDKQIPVEVKLVITQPDKKAGRKRVLTPSPVKQFVNNRSRSNFSSYLFGKNGENLMSSLKDIDLALLFAYGEIISKDLLEAPKYGFWNIHPSLLPKYRGPSPVAFPLINGEKRTGVTIIKMDEQIDHGPIIARENVEIQPKERRDELTNKLTDVAYKLFRKTIKTFNASGFTLDLQDQDHSKATYTKLLTKQDGYIKNEEVGIKNEEKAEQLFNKFRGLYPWPGIWTTITIQNQPTRLKITEMDLVGGKIVIKKVQLEGKNEVSFDQFKNAYKIF